MKLLHVKRRLIAAGWLLVLIALPCVWITRQYRQVNLDHALIAAIKHSDADAVDSLLAAGADPNTRDTPELSKSLLHVLWNLLHPAPLDHSPSAIIVAVNLIPRYDPVPPNFARIVKALLNKGADANAKFEGETVLVSAAHTGNPDVVKALIAAHADVNAKDREGYTALYMATDGPHTDAVRALIAAHADIDAKSKYDMTALEGAAMCGYEQSVKALIDAGADVNATDHDHTTALYHAEVYQHPAIATILRAAGAKD